MIPFIEGVIPFDEGVVPDNEEAIPVKVGDILVIKGIIPVNEGIVPVKTGIIPVCLLAIPLNKGTVLFTVVFKYFDKEKCNFSIHAGNIIGFQQRSLNPHCSQNLAKSRKFGS